MTPAPAMSGNLPAQNRMQGWDNYPAALPRSLRSAEDVYDLRDRLDQKSQGLFITDLSKRKLEVWVEGAGMSDEIAHANIASRY